MKAFNIVGSLIILTIIIQITKATELYTETFLTVILFLMSIILILCNIAYLKKR